tara:strand:- start:499 stop:648 length:150 start_codon:yes stop_codon:yes gene_type:complete
MFMVYNAISFSVLLEGGAGVIFEATSGEESPTNKPTPIKVTQSKFDLNT